MLTLHENPVLNDVHIPPTATTPGFDADVVLPAFLRNSYEKVKFMLAPVGLEELSKIWATINQPYRLSVAYEASLVELTPTTPPPVDAGIVITTRPTIIAWQAAQLTSLVPASGALVRIAAGQVTANQLVIRGSGLTIPGQTSVVTVAGQAVPIVASTPVPNESLTVTLPANPNAGPVADVDVLLAGRSSSPLSFNITPWLSFVTPIRTALDPTSPADLTLQLTGIGFTATPTSVRLEGSTGTSTVAAFDPGGTDKQANITIPVGLANGLYQVRLVLGGPANNATNSRTLQVIPLVNTPIVVAVVVVNGQNVHRLTINGNRLDGADVRISIDNVVHQTGTNGTSNQLVYTLGTLLDPGTHTLSVNVDGQASRTLQFGV